MCLKCVHSAVMWWLLNGNGSVVWNVRKGFSKGADPAELSPLWPSPFFLPPAWKLDTEAKELKDSYGLKKSEFCSKDWGAGREELAGFLRPVEPLFQSWADFPLDFYCLGKRKKKKKHAFKLFILEFLFHVVKLNPNWFTDLPNW